MSTSTLHQLAIGLSISEKTLHSWNKSFKITPVANAEGQYIYNPNQKELILRIHHLIKERGFTIAGAKKELVKAPIEPQKKATIQKLKEIKSFFQELKHHLDD